MRIIKYSVAISAAVGFMIGAYYYPAEIFIAFVAGLFLIPAAFVAYMIYGLWKHMMERKHRITVVAKPTPTMKTIQKESLKNKNRLKP